MSKRLTARAGDVAAELAQRFEYAGVPERALPEVIHLTRVAFGRVAIEGTLSLAERGLRLASALPDGQDRRLAEFRLYTLTVAAQRIRFGASQDLARLLDARSRRSDARDILGDTYGRFTEGFEMREIAEARRLLQELGG